MSRYVVLCGCDGTNQRIIAWIDDDRPQAVHVRVESNTGFVEARANNVNKRGGLLSYSMGCRACRQNVNVSEATVNDIVDKVIPIRDKLEVTGIPSLHQPLSEEEFAARAADAHKQIMHDLYGKACPVPKPEVVTPNATRFEMRYVIPFDLLQGIVTRLRDRSRR